MSVLSDLRVLYHMVASPVKGKTHAERLDSFYAGQSGDYDDFRKRLLPGRAELWSEIPGPRQGAVWIDMGGGTGSNLENFGTELNQLAKVYVVRSLQIAAGSRSAENRRLAKRGDCRRGRNRVPPHGRSGRCGHLLVFADHDSRLVRGRGERVALPATRGPDRRR